MDSTEVLSLDIKRNSGPWTLPRSQDFSFNFNTFLKSTLENLQSKVLKHTQAPEVSYTLKRVVSQLNLLGKSYTRLKSDSFIHLAYFTIISGTKMSWGQLHCPVWNVFSDFIVFVKHICFSLPLFSYSFDLMSSTWVTFRLLRSAT